MDLAYVITTFSDMLREAGVTEEQLRTISVDNPRRLLAGDMA